MSDPAATPSPVDDRTRRGGPRTPEGKARSARNALRHGLRAGRFCLLPHEDADAFAALVEELRRAHAPADPVELLYVDAIAIAIWRELRADRLEAEALADIPPAEPERGCGSDLTGAAARASLATIVRYRAAAQAEHRRALAMLREHRRLQAEAAARTAAPAAAEQPVPPLPEVPEPCRVELRERAREQLLLRARIRAKAAELAAREAAAGTDPAPASKAAPPAPATAPPASGPPGLGPVPFGRPPERPPASFAALARRRA